MIAGDTYNFTIQDDQGRSIADLASISSRFSLYRQAQFVVNIDDVGASVQVDAETAGFLRKLTSFTGVSFVDRAEFMGITSIVGATMGITRGAVDTAALPTTAVSHDRGAVSLFISKVDTVAISADPENPADPTYARISIAGAATAGMPAGEYGTQLALTGTEKATWDSSNGSLEKLTIETDPDIA